MKILVTGAKGMLGQDLIPLIMQNGWNVLATDAEDLDITDENKVLNFIKSEKPDYVVNCAAYTNVDAAEKETEIAFLVNYKGAENLAKASAKFDIPIIHISTDYVFNGTKNTPYEPDDKVNPINVYGESKLKGEQSVQTNNPKHYILRTSWLYGHKGKNFVETMLGLAKSNNELKVVSDQVGCPTWTVELCNCIISFIKEIKPYGIYHICGSGNTSWHGFAQEIFKLSNIDIKVNPVTTDEFPRPAKRPAYSIMNNYGACPDWKESLKKYLELRKQFLL